MPLNFPNKQNLFFVTLVVRCVQRISDSVMHPLVDCCFLQYRHDNHAHLCCGNNNITIPSAVLNHILKNIKHMYLLEDSINRRTNVQIILF
jgi:hypothetical protein